MQSSRCNDLLGADFPARHPGVRTRYVLYNPGFVATGMADPLPGPQRVLTKVAASLFATPVHKAIRPIVALLDDPPREAMSARLRNKGLDTTAREFDPGNALRLRRTTEEILNNIGSQ